MIGRQNVKRPGRRPGRGEGGDGPEFSGSFPIIADSLDRFTGESEDPEVWRLCVRKDQVAADERDVAWQHDLFRTLDNAGPREGAGRR